MSSDESALTIEDVQQYVREKCFASDRRGTVGVEMEWLTFPSNERLSPVDPVRLSAAVADAQLPRGGLITLEPGGQVELSTLPEPGMAQAVSAVEADGAVLFDTFDRHGIGLVPLGIDPLRANQRIIDGPRYGAMESYFDAQGDSGRTMMCSTASIQLNLDLNGPTSLPHRWALLHMVGPMLAAAFANSPLQGGLPSGFRSTRLATWLAIDPSRTRPVSALADDPGATYTNRSGNGGEPAQDWARYALDARVMLIRPTPEQFIPTHEHLTFESWMRNGHQLGYPTLDDFAYHLTTLFPPIRPRGWFELRMIDVLPDPWWRAAVALISSMLDDPIACEVATAATASTASLWHEAARHGPAYPPLSFAARKSFGAALEAVQRSDADVQTLDSCAAFVDQYVDRGRCPADDVLDRWALDGTFMAFDSVRRA